MTKVNLYSSGEARIQTPGISLRTLGGSLFPAMDPGQIISIQVLRPSDSAIVLTLGSCLFNYAVFFDICSSMSMSIAWRLSRARN